MMGEFRVPDGMTTTVEIERKRSRFIAWVRRVEDESAARAFVAEARATFPDARHHCSAWVLCAPGQQPTQHSSDDGEPSGTAGRPILDVLVGSGLGNVACVVTRYFGGTLLGTGGLVRAYGDAVTAALDGLPRLRVETLRTFTFSVDYTQAGRVEDALRAKMPLSVVYESASARVTVATNAPKELGSLVAEITSQPVSLVEGESRMIEIPVG